ncbi:LytR C-terminal domain-containing protein [uncultured Amnibacterium sp.]|uniref:LytR C-terminal domain-containing protein n=1 Tax=uncultured Amnibacterium sp. TaxID=1631851 RepID=UPI0035CA0702
MPDFPRDRFDELPADLTRIGAHRAPARRGRVFVAFAWAALATGVLVGAGVVGLRVIDSRNAGGTGPTQNTSSAPSVVATVDPKEPVVLLNATTTNGLAATAAAAAKADSWTVQSTANASSTAVKTTVVYYARAGQAGAAKGLAKSLGITRTQQSSQFAAGGTDRLTVVLGADYAKAH